MKCPKQIGYILLSVMICGFLFANPVYAQDELSGRQSIFGKIYSNFFHLFKGGDKLATPDAMQKESLDISGTPKPKSAGELSIGKGYEERLTQFVKTGKITEAQKQAILAEVKSLQMKLKAIQDEAKSWATSQGIEPSLVFGGLMFANPYPMPVISPRPTGIKPTTERPHVPELPETKNTRGR